MDEMDGMNAASATTMGREASEGGGEASRASDTASAGGGLLGALMSNPALLSGMLSGLSGAVGASGASGSAGAVGSSGGGESAASAGETVSAGASVGSAPAAGSGFSPDMLGAVLSDPQMMAKLPEVMAMLKPMMAGMSGGAASSAAVSAKPAQDGGGGEAKAVIASPSKHVHDRRLALLKALRPYMSPRRQEAIDYILRMDRLGNMFRNT